MRNVARVEETKNMNKLMVIKPKAKRYFEEISADCRIIFNFVENK